MNRMMLVVVGAAAAFTLAACAGSSTNSTGSAAAGSATASATGSASPTVTGTPASGAHNDADVSFAAGMVPHHAQAVQMADLATDKATSADVKTLAAAIKTAQGPEIAQMSGWLVGWGQPAPETSAAEGDMGGMDMGSMGPGMMSTAEIASLTDATGAAFDRQWVTLMIKHHTGAVAIATTELSSGSSPDAKALAQSIITSQTGEITRMTGLLASLPTG